MSNIITDFQRMDKKLIIKILSMWIFGILIGIGLTCYFIGITSLFLHTQSLSALGQAFFIAGSLGLLFSVILTNLQAYFLFSRLALIHFALVSLLIFVFYTTLQGNPQNKDIIFWGFICMIPMYSMTLLSFEGIFTRFFNTQESKRFSDISVLSITLTSIVVLIIITFNENWTNANIIYLLNYAWIAFLTAMAFLAGMSYFFSSLKIIREDLKEVKAYNNIFKMMEDRFKVYLVFFVIIAFTIDVFVDYFFFNVLQEKYAKVTIDNILSFVSMFMAVILIFTALIQLFAFKTLITKQGFRTSLLILPLALLVFFPFVLYFGFSTEEVKALDGKISYLYGYDSKSKGFVLFFILICVAKLLKDVIINGIQIPAFRISLSAIEIDLRFDTQIKLEGFVRDLAVWVAGVLLLVTDSLSAPMVYEIILVMFLLGVLAYCIFELYKEYKLKLEKNLTAQSQKNGNQSIQKQTLADEIAQKIHTIPATQIEIYLNILNILNSVIYRQVILQLLDSKNGIIQEKINEIENKIQATIAQIDPNIKNILVDKSTEKEKNITDISTQKLRPIEKKLNDLIIIANQKIRDKSIEEDLRDQIAIIKEEFIGILNHLREINRKIALNIDEEVHLVALLQAGKLCVLESIPVLDVVMKSKYFPLLNHADVIQQTYNRLLGAEYRLERIRYITQLTLSKKDPERVFGALITTYYPHEQSKEELLSSLFFDRSYQVRYQTIVASTYAKSPSLHKLLIENLDNSLYSNAAFSAIVATGEAIIPALESAFFATGQKEIVLLRIVQIYGQIRSEKSIDLLLQKLNHPSQNVSALALDTLSECGYKMKDERANTIKTELQKLAEYLVNNMSMVLDLKKVKGMELLKEAMEDEVKNLFDRLFSLLALIYNPTSVMLIRRNLNSGNPEEAESAGELLAGLLEDSLQPILLPLFDTSKDYEDKVSSLYSEFPTKPMNPQAVLASIVQQDYKWLNRWTKSCALSELAQMIVMQAEAQREEEIMEIFLANVINPDEMLAEIAYKALFEMKAPQLARQMKYVGTKKGYQKIANLAQNMKYLEESTANISRLKFDIAKFLRNVDEFKYLSGLVIADIARITELQIFQKNQVIAEYESIEEIDFFVVYSGEVVLQTNQIRIQNFQENGFLHNLTYLNQDMHNISIVAEKDCIVYKIPTAKFQEMVAFNEAIPNSILKYHSKLQTVVEVLSKNDPSFVINSLALREINKIIDFAEYPKNTNITQYEMLENLDYIVVESGMIQLTSGKLELARLSSRQLISRISPKLIDKNYGQVQLKTIDASCVIKIPFEQYEEVRKRINFVVFLKNIPEFRTLNDVSLLKIADFIEIKNYREDEVVAEFSKSEDLDYLVIFNGKIEMSSLKNEKAEKSLLEKQSFLHPFSYLLQPITQIKLLAKSKIEVYRIQKDKFNELINSYDQIPLAFLKLHYPNGLYEIVRFLNGKEDFKRFSAMQLLSFAMVTTRKEYEAGDRIATFSSVEEMDYFVVYIGDIQMQYGKNEVENITEGKSINPLNNKKLQNTGIRFFAINACTVYRLPRNIINQIMQQPDLILESALV